MSQSYIHDKIGKNQTIDSQILCRQKSIKPMPTPTPTPMSGFCNNTAILNNPEFPQQR